MVIYERCLENENDGDDEYDEDGIQPESNNSEMSDTDFQMTPGQTTNGLHECSCLSCTYCSYRLGISALSRYRTMLRVWLSVVIR